MPAAAIPSIISAGGALGSGILGFLGAKKASTPGKGEAAATQTQNAASNSLLQQGGQLTGYGMPKLEQAGNYFSKLTSGNRAVAGQALAPEAENINALYGGTQRTLSRFLRGPDRDSAMADLSMKRAGALGSLFTGARQRGVEGLVNLGQYGVSQGQASLSGAAGIAGNVGAAGMQNRYAGADLQRQAGGDTASLIFQLLKSGSFKWGGGGGGMPGTNIGVPQIPGGGR